MVYMASHVNIYADLTDHFADPFVGENVVRIFDVVVHYDVQKFDAATILYGDIWCKKMDILMIQRCFQVQFWFE